MHHKIGWAVLVVKSLLWLFKFMNAGVLAAVVVAASFGAATPGVHALVMLSILVSFVTLGWCIAGELRSLARSRASAVLRGSSSASTPTPVVSERTWAARLMRRGALAKGSPIHAGA